MKNSVFLFTAMFCIFLAYQASAQPQNQESQTKSLSSKSSRMSFGLNLNQFQNDFGIGINLTSPFFIHDNVAIRFAANHQWFQNIPVGSVETTWSGYNNFQLGLVGVGGVVANSIRLYGEGGVVMIMPNSEFSNINKVGGYGLFGFEFFMIERMNYFIELGGVGTGATAEKIAGKPIYSNGFLMSTGLRIYL